MDKVGSRRVVDRMERVLFYTDDSGRYVREEI